MPVTIQTKGTATDHPKTETIKTMIRAKIGSHFRALDLRDPELSVLLCGDQTIRSLNADWRDVDEPTDVLSFPARSPGPEDAGPALLGDIILDLEYAERLVDSREHHRRVADELDVPPETLEWSLSDEVEFLLIHGLLHLVGYDHTDDAEEREMKAAERRLWEATRPRKPG